MAETTIQEQITEVKREIAMRERVYPKWISNGRLDSLEAAKQLERMKAVLHTLQELEAKESAPLLRALDPHPEKSV